MEQSKEVGIIDSCIAKRVIPTYEQTEAESKFVSARCEIVRILKEYQFSVYTIKELFRQVKFEVNYTATL